MKLGHATKSAGDRSFAKLDMPYTHNIPMVGACQKCMGKGGTIDISNM